MPPRKSNLSTVSVPPVEASGARSAHSTDVPPGFQTSMDTADEAGLHLESGGQSKANKKSVDGLNGAENHKESEKPKAPKKVKDEMGVDDLLLPRTLMSRLARGSLPPNTSLQKDALLALTKSATVFISYLAHTSNQLTSRKTIQAQDVLEAIREMELENVMGQKLLREVQTFEDGVKDKRKGYRDRVKARETRGGLVAPEGESLMAADEDMGREHDVKRIKRDVDGDVSMQVAEDGSDEDNDDDDDDDDEGPSAQLEAEAAMAEHDQTEAEDDQDEDDEAEEDDEDEEQQEDDDQERSEDDSRLAQRKGPMLAPNGREEVESGDESD